jgi:thiol-disulfide isomerase/thioredoxin
MRLTPHQIAVIILTLTSVQYSGGTALADPPRSDVQLQTIDYRKLGDLVKAQRGKVVVVDVWASYCVPCKREFPNLVRMYGQYAADGLVCLSVTVDKEAQHEAALAFLRKQKATFNNYRLTDEEAVWQKAWKISGPPAVFVFDRNGKRAARFDGEDEKRPVNYDEIEVIVRKLLRPGA